MKNKNKISSIILILIINISCSTKQKNFDASGSFEAVETIISSEVSGVIQKLDLEEGEILKKGEIVGYIDTLQLYLKKKQIMAQIKVILGKKPNIKIQLSALETKLNSIKKEKIRIEKLIKGDAATQKQLDDINTNIEVIKNKIAAYNSSLQISYTSIENEVMPLFVQLEQLNTQIQNSIITNPVKGTVLSKYAEPFEMTMPGKPIYKIADLSTIILRVYISGNQLSKVKLNHKVTVLTDSGNKKMNEAEGKITWISNKAEFTPKGIQTKDERANMVYAVKIKVKNDGIYKIGMYGEIKF